jgi:ABC-type uncharacterized transport system ATPase subunit
MAVTADAMVPEEPSLGIKHLTYAYPGHFPILKDLSFDLPRGSRCLLIGGNGAGTLPIDIPLANIACLVDMLLFRGRMRISVRTPDWLAYTGCCVPVRHTFPGHVKIAVIS